MNSPETSENEFIRKLTEIVEANITNPQFGVSMLAKEMGLSRFMLHRKVKEISKITASQFINQLRLHKAKDILRNTNTTVSDVAFQTGFNSTSYFIKCFHDYFGYPPGEYIKYATAETVKEDNATLTNENSKDKSLIKAPSVLNKKILIIVIVIAIVISGIFVVNNIGNKDLAIAVLVPKNLTGQDNIEHFLYGVQADLIRELSQLEQLRVIAQWSTLQFKDSIIALKDIATKLNADLLLVPGLLSVGDRMEIDLSLVDVSKDERNIWTEKYETEMRNILHFYSLATNNIAQELHLNLSDDVKRRLSQTRKVNPETWAAYYRGMYKFDQGYESFKEGMKILKDAVDKDPADPFAYAALALGYAFMGHGSMDSEDAFQLAEAAAKRAIQIDPTMENAHIALAMYSLYQLWDWNKAKTAFENAIVSNPSKAVAYAHFAWYHILFNDKEKTIYYAEQATVLDPLNPSYKAWLSVIYLNFEEYDKAEYWAKKAKKLDENMPWALITMGSVSIHKKDFEKAFEFYDRLPEGEVWNAFKVRAYVNAGQREKAISIWNELEKRSKKEDVNLCHMGRMASALGFTDRAFELLNEAIDKKHYPILNINLRLWSVYIENDPRYNELLKRLNLPTYSPKPSE